MRVSDSSVISSEPETRATPRRVRDGTAGTAKFVPESATASTGIPDGKMLVCRQAELCRGWPVKGWLRLCCWEPLHPTIYAGPVFENAVACAAGGAAGRLLVGLATLPRRRRGAARRARRPPGRAAGNGCGRSSVPPVGQADGDR